MGARLAVVYVQNKYSDHYAEAYEKHREQDVAPKKGEGQGSGRYDFRDEEEEHGLRQEDGDA